jgi:transcriptional regulator with AAA-type ATPase domain/ABC-type nitrate/sulfonate/bicarbonate transport system substrate-binding protein
VLFPDAASAALQVALDRLAPTDATVLISGETGTGKEVAARYLHAQSRRRAGPFLAVNCGALSETLAEAELFGHEKGAFTGALQSQPGWFEAARGGTLLLDEIGDLPLPLQVKLLRVLQERVVTRLGSRLSVPVNVRIIAATNIDLRQAISERKFREDLYFRLNVAHIALPPLRERAQAIPAMAEHFLQHYRSLLDRPAMSISAAALQTLLRHPWPGNIRELENTIHNAVLLTPGDVIESDDLELLARTPPVSQDAALEPALAAVFARALARKEENLFERVTAGIVQAALSAVDGNQVRAAAALGISRNSLRTQMANLGNIQPRRRLQSERRSIPASPGREIRIGYQKFGTLNILKALGTLDTILADERVTIRWEGFSSGPPLLEALRQGTLDFGATGEVPPVFAQAGGAPFLYVAHEPAVPQGVALVVPQDSKIYHVDDLRGKRLKFSRGSNVHYLVLRALETHGLSLDDVEMIFAEPQDPVSYIDNGGADGWAFWDPLLPLVQRSRQLRTLLDGTGLVFNHQFYLSSERFAAQNDSILPILLEQLRAAGMYVANQPADAATLLAAKIGVEADSLKVAFTRLAHGPRPLSREVIGEQQRIADRFYALGVLPRAISVRAAVLSN